MAIKVDGKIVRNKDVNKTPKTIKDNKKSLVGEKCWFIEKDKLDLYVGHIVEDRDDGFYLISATNRNIHKSNEEQTCIVPKKSVKFK